MMRPVILSRPENTACGLAIRCGGGSTTSSSPGCGAVLACCPLRGCFCPGGNPGSGRAPCGCSCAGACGDTGPPGSGASGADSIEPAPGRLDGGKLIGAGSGCDGGTSGRASAGGRWPGKFRCCCCDGG